MLQSSSSKKKLVKPLKNCFADPICTEKRSFWATLKVEKILFGRNNKSRLSAFRRLLFYQNIISFDWVMNLFLSWVMFSVKKSVISSENSCEADLFTTSCSICCCTVFAFCDFSSKILSFFSFWLFVSAWRTYFQWKIMIKSYL